MKDTDKVTLTIGQLKKLVKESGGISKSAWRGVEGTKVIWNGEWADPEIEYDGEVINLNDVEDFAWGLYGKDCEDEGKKANEAEFDNLPTKFFKDALDDYMIGMNESVKESIDDVIDNIEDQDAFLKEISDRAQVARYYIGKIKEDDQYRQTYEKTYEGCIKSLIKKIDELKNFDVIAL